jgi:hypothetical protein
MAHTTRRIIARPRDVTRTIQSSSTKGLVYMEPEVNESVAFPGDFIARFYVTECESSVRTTKLVWFQSLAEAVTFCREYWEDHTGDRLRQCA